MRIALPLPNTGTMAKVRRRSSCVRTGVFLLLVVFVWQQLHAVSLGGFGGPAGGTAGGDSSNESAAAVMAMVPRGLHKFLTTKSRGGSGNGSNATTTAGGAHAPEEARTGLNASEIKRHVTRQNELQTVYNEDTFGSLLNDSVVIVVQVHTRITYLRHLIVSLAQAHGISGVLLVFSHDFYDEEINELVQSVDFCKVMQIYYPFSIQMHPNEFPGTDPDDCPRNFNKDQALRVKCNNAEYPDVYGHYREAKFTQTKHHWWWKANRVFDQLEITRYHSGPVIFLEEDHYVSPDFLHVLRLMQMSARTLCPRCNILSLGTYLKTYNYYGQSKRREALRAIKSSKGAVQAGQVPPAWGFQVLPSLYSLYQKVEVTPWVSSKHNMGMALNRTTWQEFRACARQFCSYDDYNWDWSLQHMSQVCLRHKMHVMVVRGPRVFHIGECGVHQKNKNCEYTSVISKVQHVLQVAGPHLFPSRLTLAVTSTVKKHKLRKGNGGWGDHRDHALCLNMTAPVR